MFHFDTKVGFRKQIPKPKNLPNFPRHPPPPRPLLRTMMMMQLTAAPRPFYRMYPRLSRLVAQTLHPLRQSRRWLQRGAAAAASCRWAQASLSQPPLKPSTSPASLAPSAAIQYRGLLSLLAVNTCVLIAALHLHPHAAAAALKSQKVQSSPSKAFRSTLSISLVQIAA